MRGVKIEQKVVCEYICKVRKQKEGKDEFGLVCAWKEVNFLEEA